MNCLTVFKHCYHSRDWDTTEYSILSAKKTLYIIAILTTVWHFVGNLI